MRETPSKTRRNLVVAGAAGLATLAAPKAWQTRLAQTVVLPATAQEIPTPTGEIKVQYGQRKGRWGVGANAYNAVPLEIYNLFGQGTLPTVHEVQIHFKLDFRGVNDLKIELMSPDGYTITLMDRPGSPHGTCSQKGVDITFVDTALDNCCASIADVADYCPEWTSNKAEKIFGIWERKRLQGVFHTHTEPASRRLPLFNGRLAVGIWNFRVYNYSTKNVNKVIKQIDLTVYSKW